MPLLRCQVLLKTVDWSPDWSNRQFNFTALPRVLAIAVKERQQLPGLLGISPPNAHAPRARVTAYHYMNQRKPVLDDCIVGRCTSLSISQNK